MNFTCYWVFLGVEGRNGLKMVYLRGQYFLKCIILLATCIFEIVVKVIELPLASKKLF